METITEIHSGVYDITIGERNGGRYRVFLFDGDRPTLVDAGLPETVDAIGAALSDLGIEPVRTIVTHGDPDHAGGLPGLVDRYDIETWVPAGTAVDVAPNHRYGDGDEIGRFEAVSVPGHTPNHHALLDESNGIAVLGDALFGSDARGLPQGHFVLPPAFFSQDLDAAEENLERLLAFDFEIGLVYHGSNVTDGASEKIADFVDFRGKP